MWGKIMLTLNDIEIGQEIATCLRKSKFLEFWVMPGGKALIDR